MKHLLTAIIIATLCLGTQASAQPQGPDPLRSEQMLLARLKSIKQSLRLTEQQVNDFYPVYRDYDTEMRHQFEAHRQKMANLKDDNMKDAMAKVNARIDMKMSILKIQKKYYQKFQKVLTPKQIVRLERAERKVGDSMQRRLDRGNKRRAADAGRRHSVSKEDMERQRQQQRRDWERQQEQYRQQQTTQADGEMQRLLRQAQDDARQALQRLERSMQATACGNTPQCVASALADAYNKAAEV